MRKVVILLLYIFSLNSFGQCPIFETMQERANYLLDLQTQYKTSNEQQKKGIEQNFFCAFPDSFSEMEQLFGLDMETGDAAPLYNYPDGMNTITFFTELKTIEPSKYYEKYVNININGNWQADNISDAFWISEKFFSEPQEFCQQLNKRTDEELISVFRFMFDGPHPTQVIDRYQEFHSKLKAKNSRLSELLAKAYKQLIDGDDGHGY